MDTFNTLAGLVDIPVTHTMQRGALEFPHRLQRIERTHPVTAPARAAAVSPGGPAQIPIRSMKGVLMTETGTPVIFSDNTTSSASASTIARL